MNLLRPNERDLTVHGLKLRVPTVDPDGRDGTKSDWCQVFLGSNPESQPPR